MKFLVTGAGGQLAREFSARLEKKAGHSVVSFTRAQLDITDARMVADAFAHFSPDVVVNCAAYNQVDKAENDFDTALRVNAVAVRNLAVACRKASAFMIHFSTDYVFDGSKEALYTEDDVPHPLNKYGDTKLAGERVLADEFEQFLLFRVSWVFGPGSQNFLYKLSEWARDKKTLRVVADQVSAPTYTEDIVAASLEAWEKGARGLYHLTNSGYASRYEVARFYAEQAGLTALLLPVPTSFFPAAAQRPSFSAMSNAKLAALLGRPLPHWRDGIERYIKRVNR